MSRTALAALAAAGLLFAAVTVLYVGGPGWLPSVLALAALAFAITAAVRGRSELSRLARARTTRRGALAAASTVIVLLCLAILGFLAERHALRIDLTKERVNSLDSDTRRIVESIPDDTRVELLAVGSTGAPFSAEQVRLLSLLDAATDSLQMRPVVAEREPVLVRELGVTRFPAVVARVHAPGADEPRVRMTDTISERAIARTLEQALLGELPVAAVVQGHGEMSPADNGPNGLSAAAADITADNFRVETVSLRDGIPEDAAVVIVAGPETDLLEAEREVLDAFLADGGSALVLFGPPLTGGSQQGWHAWLESWGVDARRDLVADLDGLLGGRDLATLLADPAGSHPVVDGFARTLLIPVARSVRPTKVAPDRTDVSVLLRSDEGSWAETSFTGSGPHFDEGVDEEGPLPLAVAVERRRRGEGGVRRPAERLVVVGSSRFAANHADFSQGNPDFVLAALAWLSEREDVLAERRRGFQQDGTVVVAAAQFRLILVATLLVPVIVLLAGIGQWVLRRRL